ncbi:hypothetical protein [Dysgonomonas macrotermitis]|uniref:Uncharacterized protein n=1 Tax=Dysgonomonas macrotermitis TaxID=1346286 RepID=A0A1M5DWG0_9BACT|nr:hypothetical protein [Dysgonomonas macrotermitis]SHF71204.1 hypothetical protein SAMN05444362_10973 [Dysgonomonas macrotermitis]
MRVKDLLLVFISGVFLPVFAQSGKVEQTDVLEAVWNEKYVVYEIPDDALSGNYSSLLYPYILRENEQDTTFFSAEIYWNSVAIDGRYILEITPLQVLLYSSHDNSNPNYLYWMANLQENEYRKIISHFRILVIHESEVMLEPYSGRLCFIYDWLFTDPALLSSGNIKSITNNTKYEKMYDQITKDHLYINFFVLLNEINSCLDNRHISVPEKEIFFSTQILRMINNTDELAAPSTVAE